jgi:uncharacterized membrane protein
MTARRYMFPPMLATIVDPGYKIALFLHILAVVLAFGPTFGYGFFVAVAEGNSPRSVPTVLRAVQMVDRFLVQPGLIVVLLAGIYLLADGPWEAGDAFVSVGFLAIIVLFGLSHGFFRPQTARALELAERDLKAGDTLSDEYGAVSKRLENVGKLAGLIVAVTIFFMAYKPFL